MKVGSIITKLNHIKRDAGYYLELVNMSKTAGKNYNQPRTKVFLRGASLLRKRRFTPRYSVDMGILNPAVDISEADLLVSREEFSNLQIKINPKELFSLTENKGIFYKFCELNNIPSPKILVEFFGSSVSSVNDGGIKKNKAEWIDFFENTAPDEFVIKPHNGVYGKGIKGISRTRRGFKDNLGTELNSEEIVEYMMHHKEYKNFLIQEMIKAHKSIAGLTGTTGVSSLRTVTLVDKSGKAKILYASIKLISGSNFTDNHERGETGNLIGLLDLKKGEIVKVYGAVDENGIAKEIKIHPQTGKEMVGFKIPMWSDFKNTIKYTAEKFTPLRCIGWDVAVTDNGIKLIEGNVMFDPPNFFRLGRMIENEILKTLDNEQ